VQSINRLLIKADAQNAQLVTAGLCVEVSDLLSGFFTAPTVTALFALLIFKEHFIAEGGTFYSLFSECQQLFFLFLEEVVCCRLPNCPLKQGVHSSRIPQCLQALFFNF